MIHTQCPKCKTTFRVTDTQLSAALGTVRCGLCEHIFSATECQVLEQQASKPTEETGKYPDIDTPAETKVAVEQPTTTQPDADLALPQDICSAELIDDDEFSESFKSISLGHTTSADFEKDKNQYADESYDTVSEDEWALALLAADSKKSAKPEPEKTSDISSDSRLNDDGDDQWNPDSTLLDTATGNDQSDEFHIPDLELDVDDISEPPPAAPKSNSLLWGFLTFLALIALIGQIGFFYFDRLALDYRLRPAYQFICDTFGCELPVQRDIDSISSSGLSIQPHPKLYDALTVDLILTNNASFPQSFPKVQLNFSSLDQTPVASRVFKPEEYLNADFSSVDTMPIATPIYLSFEIKHPGEEASNFSVKVVP
ncbi:MAG: DUF3426 domain-containing protein [Pseudomonadales bacterium]|nr:DUF3426 domain-containing protein [Pseudomonadales bacterium]